MDLPSLGHAGRRGVSLSKDDLIFLAVADSPSRAQSILARVGWVSDHCREPRSCRVLQSIRSTELCVTPHEVGVDGQRRHVPGVRHRRPEQISRGLIKFAGTGASGGGASSGEEKLRMGKAQAGRPQVAPGLRVAGQSRPRAPKPPSPSAADFGGFGFQ